jgi:hypothetical protein
MIIPKCIKLYVEYNIQMREAYYTQVTSYRYNDNFIIYFSISLPSLSSLRRGRSPEGGLTNPVYDGYGAESETDVSI